MIRRYGKSALEVDVAPPSSSLSFSISIGGSANIPFGKEQWERYIGDVGSVPPPPANIEAILANPCPFWPNRRVEETHALFLIPKTVDGKPLTLRLLGKLVQHPKQGPASKYREFWDQAMLEHGDTSIEAAYWVLITRNYYQTHEIRVWQTKIRFFVILRSLITTSRKPWK